MKAVLHEHTGSRGGVITKRPSQARIAKLLKKKEEKKAKKCIFMTKKR